MDGSAWRIRRGEDFAVSTESMASMLRTQASSRGVTVRYRRDGERVAVEIGGGGSVLSARALTDDDEPNVVEVEYVPADQLAGTVERLEALRPLVDACGDGDLDSPWNTDALVKLAKGVRAAIGDR
jgi:hypothetical protein